MNSSSRRVPRIAELRPIAQGEKVGADKRWWYVIFRRVSIYVTWALLHTKATANQVTVGSLVIAFGGLVMVGAPNAWLAVAGYLALLAYHLLDRVDGEIARVRATYSLYGIYLDNAGHYLTGAGILVATTYRLTPEASEPRILWLVGVFGALAAVMARMEKHAPFHLFSQYVIKRPSLARTLEAAPEGALTRSAVRSSRSVEAETPRRSLLEVGRDMALALTAFPSVVTILLVGTLAEITWDRPTIAVWTLVLVSVLQIVTYLALEVAMLTQSLASETLRLLDEFEPPQDS
jgi:phosphatidylglycerophosphate synthase